MRLLIDNAATASQNDFDEVTREAIALNIGVHVETLLDACERAEFWLGAHREGAGMKHVLREAIESLPHRNRTDSAA